MTVTSLVFQCIIFIGFNNICIINESLLWHYKPKNGSYYGVLCTTDTPLVYNLSDYELL